MSSLYTVSTGGQLLAQDINQLVQAVGGVPTAASITGTSLPDAGASGRMVTWGARYLALSCTSSGYVDIYDFSGASSASQIARINVSSNTAAGSNPKGLAMMGGDRYLVVAAAQGYAVYDVTLPTFPSFLSYVNFGAGVGGNLVLGYGRSIISTSTESGGVARIGDFGVSYGSTASSSPNQPANDAFIFRNMLVTLGGTDIRFTKITPPATLGTTTAVDTDAWTFTGAVNFVSGCALTGRYMALWDAGALVLRVVDVADPYNAHSLGIPSSTVSVGVAQNTPSLCTAFGRYIAVANYGGSGGTGNAVQIWDLSSPGNPTLAETVTVGTGNFGINGVCLVGGRYLAITSANFSSVYLWDISGGTEMLAASANSLHAGGLVVSGDVIITGRLSVGRSLDVQGSSLITGGQSTL